MSEKRKEIIEEWREMDTALRPELLDSWKVNPPQGYMESLETRLMEAWSLQSSKPIDNGDANVRQKNNHITRVKMLPTNKTLISAAAVICCLLATLFLFDTTAENETLQIDNEMALIYLEEDLLSWEVADLVYADVMEDHLVLYDEISLDVDNLEHLEAELLDEELLVE